MELGNLYIYTGPEKMKCLTLAEDSFAKAFPAKAKANDKVVWLLANEWLSTLGSSSRARCTFDLQLLKWSSVCCAGNPSEHTPAVEAGGWQMCCQTGLVALLFGSPGAPEIFEVRRIHHGKKKGRSRKKRWRKASGFNGVGDESNFLPLLSLEGVSQLSKNRLCHTVHSRNGSARELSVYWQDGN